HHGSEEIVESCVSLVVFRHLIFLEMFWLGLLRSAGRPSCSASPGCPGHRTLTEPPAGTSRIPLLNTRSRATEQRRFSGALRDSAQTLLHVVLLPLETAPVFAGASLPRGLLLSRLEVSGSGSRSRLPGLPGFRFRSATGCRCR